MVNDGLTPAERRFRVWMLISAWMYALSGLFFLIAGTRIAPFVNAISGKVFPSLSLYPLPGSAPEGAFWRVLSVSMMAMITWICRSAYLDLRRNGRLIPVLLLSKFCSASLYLFFFATRGHLAQLVGFLTDGPLFLMTLALWLPAETGDRFMDGAEEDIIAALGDAFLPRGGAFELGYADVRDKCIADVRKMMAVQPPVTRLGSRILLHALDLSPVFLALRPVTLRNLPVEKRQEFLRRIECHRLAPLRLILFAIKLFVSVPFFNQPEAERAVGYLQPEVER
jgi:hypothetical protein